MKNDKMVHRFLHFASLAGLALLIFGCSDGGSYSPAASSSANGTVAQQGKVKNAKVCADLNFNDRCDSGEPFTITNATTAFSGSYFVRNIPANTPYQFVTEGGVDSLTGLPALPLKALSGVRNITPITTLVARSADPVAITALLDSLSGGQGYDIDISGAPMPPAFLSLAKCVEELLYTLAQSGLSSAADQALVLQDIATVLIRPESATLPLGTIFSQAATLIAARNDFVDFKVAPLDAAAFANIIGQMATAVETQVDALVDNNGVVAETPALQDLIDSNVIVPPLPVMGVSLYTAQIAILNNAGAVVGSVNSDASRQFADLSLLSANFAKAKVTVFGTNTLTPPTARSYPDASFTLMVSDNGSNRSLQVVLSGITVAIDSAGLVTLSVGTTLELRGINSDGSVVLQKSLPSAGTLVTVNNNVLLFDINQLKAEVESAAGTVGVSGSYAVSATISGAPGVPAAVALTLN